MSDEFKYGPESKEYNEVVESDLLEPEEKLLCVLQDLTLSEWLEKHRKSEKKEKS